MSSEIHNVNSSTHQVIDDSLTTRKKLRTTGEIEESQESQESITELSLHGQWCAYQVLWTSGSAVITFDDGSHFEDTNMDSTALDTENGET